MVEDYETHKYKQPHHSTPHFFFFLEKPTQQYSLGKTKLQISIEKS